VGSRGGADGGSRARRPTTPEGAEATGHEEGMRAEVEVLVDGQMSWASFNTLGAKPPICSADG
jgi:hypothetical protein